MQRSLTLLLALALLPALAGCDSGEPDGGPGGGPGGACDDGTFTATVDGQSFTAECVVIDISNGMLTIAGTANLDGSAGPNQQQITIGGAQAQTGTQTPTVASYADLDANNPSAAITCVASPVAGGASLTIDAIDDDSASGSFSFTALCPNDGSTLTVANGQFDISK